MFLCRKELRVLLRLTPTAGHLTGLPPLRKIHKISVGQEPAAAAAGGRRGWLTRPLEANSWLPRPPEAGQEAESLLHSFLSNREGESALC